MLHILSKFPFAGLSSKLQSFEEFQAKKNDQVTQYFRLRSKSSDHVPQSGIKGKKLKYSGLQ